MRRRTVSCLLSLAAVLVYGSMAAAGPLPPLGTTPLVALGTPTGTVGALCDTIAVHTAGGGCGESDLSQATPDGIKTQINVDWMVLAPGYDPAWDLVRGQTGPLNTDIGAVGDVGICAGQSCYLYLYQEENSSVNAGIVAPGVTSGVNMKAMSIFPAAPVVIAGVFGANGDDVYVDNLFDDLDCGTGNPTFIAGNQDPILGCLSAGALHPGHYAAAPLGTNGVFDALDDGGTGPDGGVIQLTNANPVHEEEGRCPPGDIFGDKGDPLPGSPTPPAVPPPAGTGPGSGNCINPADPIETTFESGGITWTFLPSKPPHHETVTLFFASPVGPVYGSASTQATNATTWATLQNDSVDNPLFFGEPVPVPGLQAIPEPTTLALFGGGLIALGLLRRKVKR